MSCIYRLFVSYFSLVFVHTFQCPWMSPRGHCFSNASWLFVVQLYASICGGRKYCHKSHGFDVFVTGTLWSPGVVTSGATLHSTVSAYAYLHRRRTYDAGTYKFYRLSAVRFREVQQWLPRTSACRHLRLYRILLQEVRQRRTMHHIRPPCTQESRD